MSLPADIVIYVLIIADIRGNVNEWVSGSHSIIVGDCNRTATHTHKHTKRHTLARTHIYTTAISPAKPTGTIAGSPLLFHTTPHSTKSCRVCRRVNALFLLIRDKLANEYTRFNTFIYGVGNICIWCTTMHNVHTRVQCRLISLILFLFFYKMTVNVIIVYLFIYNILCIGWPYFVGYSNV